MTDDRVTDDAAPPPDAPPRRSGFFGPSNAAGFGGWCGVALPILAGGAVTTVAVWAEGELSFRVLRQRTTVTLLIAGAAVIPGYFAGWCGGAVVRWAGRRRRTEWPPWRAEFPAGAAAGTLLIGGLVILIVTLDR